MSNLKIRFQSVKCKLHFRIYTEAEQGTCPNGTTLPQEQQLSSFMDLAKKICEIKNKTFKCMSKFRANCVWPNDILDSFDIDIFFKTCKRLCNEVLWFDELSIFDWHFWTINPILWKILQFSHLILNGYLGNSWLVIFKYFWNAFSLQTWFKFAYKNIYTYMIIYYVKNSFKYLVEALK